MIKINLLKSFTNASADGFAGLASSSDRDQLIIQSLKRLALILIGPIALYIYEIQTMPILQGQLNTAQAELNETTTFNTSKAGLAAEIKKYEEEQTKINSQMNFVNKIAQDKINEYKLFKHLQNSTPESVWINRIEFKGNLLLISTESDVSEDLNKFLVRLSNTEFLSNIVPTDQAVRIDPFGIGINTTTQSLRAQFNAETGRP